MPTIIENRRNLHQIPEIELTTQKTAQYIENVLDLYDCTICLLYTSDAADE